MGLAAHVTIFLVVAAIGIPALVYGCVAYFGQATQDTRIDIEKLNLAQEKHDRLTSDMQLMAKILQETNTRVAELTILTNQLIQETLIRTENVTQLNNQLAQETLIRTQNVTQLENQLAQETANRMAETLNGLNATNVTLVGSSSVNVVVGGNDTIVFSVKDTAVVPGTYNFSTLTINSEGRITNATSGNTSLNGDVSGVMASNTINRIQNVPITVTEIGPYNSTTGSINLNGECEPGGGSGSYSYMFLPPFGVLYNLNSNIFTKSGHLQLNSTNGTGCIENIERFNVSSFCNPNGCAVTACVDLTGVQNGGNYSISSNTCALFRSTGNLEYVVSLGGGAISRHTYF